MDCFAALAMTTQTVIVRLCAIVRSSIPETSMIESIGRSVLDAPPSRGMTALRVASDLRGKCLRDEPSRRDAALRVPLAAQASFFGVYLPSTHL